MISKLYICFKENKQIYEGHVKKDNNKEVSWPTNLKHKHLSTHKIKPLDSSIYGQASAHACMFMS